MVSNLNVIVGSLFGYRELWMDVLEKVQDQCEGKQRYQFMANNDFFGIDPCICVIKYLILNDTCVYQCKY